MIRKVKYVGLSLGVSVRETRKRFAESARDDLRDFLNVGDSFVANCPEIQNGKYIQNTEKQKFL